MHEISDPIYSRGERLVFGHHDGEGFEGIFEHGFKACRIGSEYDMYRCEECGGAFWTIVYMGVSVGEIVLASCEPCCLF
jgi:hypothetical protein